MEERILQASWIWNDRWTLKPQSAPGLFLFRKEIELPAGPDSCMVQVSADTRYKFYVNGILVRFGPAKGDDQVWFYDTLDLAPYLHAGKNCIGAAVLRYPLNPQKGNHSLFRTAVPGLCVSGKVCRPDRTEISLDTDTSWKCCRVTGVSFVREEERFAPLMIHEKVQGEKYLIGWNLPGYDDSGWDPADSYPKAKVHGAVSPGNLLSRKIPYLYRKPRTFTKLSCIRQSRFSPDDWQAFLAGSRSLTIPPHAKEIVEIDAGEEMTGFIHAAFEGGAGSRASFLYAECYVQDEFAGAEHLPVKKDRTDKENGHLTGYSDIYELHGGGDEELFERYDPFWFRTFRFISVTIETGEEGVILKSLDYEETGYPLEVKSHGSASDPSLDAIWEISERTLRRCMHETYEDCPYYEQLQYIMDTRSQILYTYSVSADDRLARSCIETMKRSQRYDGLLNCSYPNCNPNVIPGFPVYYIAMVYDHMMYFGDRELVRETMPVIDRILNYFHRNLTAEGYVGKTGHLVDSRYWSFIDWAKEWDTTNGMPTAGLKGPVTMESFLYIYGLQKSAALARYLNRNEEAERYLKEAGEVQEALLTYCVGERGAFTDGPGVKEYSQHCQVFAVLTHTGDPCKLKENLKQTLNNPAYAQCTVAMRFYLFRALEQTGLYEYTDRYWDTWRWMVKNHCTTCIESDTYARSECHAWGALILYEMPSVILGVGPAAPGYEKIRIRPEPGYLTSASGTVFTPAGEVKVSWSRSEDGLHINYRAPMGWEEESVSADGGEIILRKKTFPTVK